VNAQCNKTIVIFNTKTQQKGSCKHHLACNKLVSAERTDTGLDASSTNGGHHQTYQRTHAVTRHAASQSLTAIYSNKKPCCRREAAVTTEFSSFSFFLCIRKTFLPTQRLGRKNHFEMRYTNRRVYNRRVFWGLEQSIHMLTLTPPPKKKTILVHIMESLWQIKVKVSVFI